MLLLLLLGRARRMKEGVDVSKAKFCTAEAEFFQLFGEWEEGWNMRSADLGATQGEGAERRRKGGKKAIDVGFQKEAIARSVAVQIQID